ncbi:hypothetical protein BDW62DRAFT_197047 [Aspergillus aurantiobrunneus]
MKVIKIEDESLRQTSPIRTPSPAPDHANEIPIFKTKIETPVKRIFPFIKGDSPDRGNEYKMNGPAYIIGWLCAGVVLGLAGAILHRADPGLLQYASIVNSAATISFSFGLDLRLPISKSQSDPVPSTASYIYVAARNALWLAAGVVMLVAGIMFDPADDSSRLTKRRGRGGSGRPIRPAPLRNLAIACGCFGLLVFLTTLMHWCPVLVALCRGFSKDETREMYEKLTLRKGEKSETAD